MPSLLGTYVAANYGRMVSQDAYGGVTYSNFGTRNLAFIKIVISGGTPPDFTAGTGKANDVYTVNSNAQDSNAYFSTAVRTIQQYGEVYFVGTPTSTAFVVAVAIDTMNSAASNSNVEVFNTAYPTLGTFGGLAAQLLTVLGSWASGAVTITQLTASGASIA